ncbi:MAG: transposase [Pseudomonadales bacterium]|nr:transposase [Pseudomonadales bacterium]
MARIKRLVVPDYPHHVVQRGNRRQAVFFNQGDYRDYLKLVADAKEKAQVDIWAYCLMPNHVHFIVVPGSEDGLAAFFSQAHRRYTLRINQRYEWQGHLWQERFHSTVMDEAHLLAAVRYVEQNPVRAGLCQSPADWPWSSARAHLSATDDCLVGVGPMLARINDWQEYLGGNASEQMITQLRKNAATGRPVGSQAFVRELERKTNRSLQLKTRGRKPRRI